MSLKMRPECVMLSKPTLSAISAIFKLLPVRRRRASLIRRVGEHFAAVAGHLYDIGYREWAIFRHRERFMVPIAR